MGQMAHFSFPCYFTIPSLEFWIPNFSFRNRLCIYIDNQGCTHRKTKFHILDIIIQYTVKPVYVATCIKGSPVLSSHIFLDPLSQNTVQIILY